MFGWFRKREAPTFIDPVLGNLVLHGSAWFGQYNFGADKRPVDITIYDQDGKPLSGAAEFVLEFEQRYLQLNGPISDELRRLFEPWYSEFWDTSERLPESDALFAMFELTAIDYSGNEKALLEFALKENWDDGRFRISLEEWVPNGLGVED